MYVLRILPHVCACLCCWTSGATRAEHKDETEFPSNASIGAQPLSTPLMLVTFGDSTTAARESVRVFAT